MRFKFTSNALRALALSLLISLSLLLTGCETNLVTGFRIGLAATTPFVTSLVKSGALTQPETNLATQDLNDGVDSLARAETCLDQTKPLSGGSKRVAKAKCYFQAAQDIRSILARHHLDGNQELNRIQVIAQGAIDAFEAYYAAVNPESKPVAVQAEAVPSSAGDEADKELERTMKKLEKDMKELTKGH